MSILKRGGPRIEPWGVAKWYIQVGSKNVIDLNYLIPTCRVTSNEIDRFITKTIRGKFCNK